jgi:hypothetical protein
MAALMMPSRTMLITRPVSMFTLKGLIMAPASRHRMSG